jgi:protein-disulfide isomerase-like protein with CxxC motif
VICFADFRLTSWKVCWSLAITERLSPMSNHRKRVNDSSEEQVAIPRAHFVEGLLVQKNEVIAELLQEHVQLKKANRDPCSTGQKTHKSEVAADVCGALDGC